MKLLIAVLAAVCAAAPASDPARVDDALKQFDDRVAGLRAEFAKLPSQPYDHVWVRKDLAHMAELDKILVETSGLPFAQGYSDEERHKFEDEFEKSFQSIRSANEAELKSLIKRHGWLAIGAFGKKADSDAWSIVRHCDQDPEFQKDVLKLLEPLVDKRETDPANYARLVDQVASVAGEPQRFGTQGSCKGAGKWEPDEIAEPEKVEERRAKLGMPAMEEQKKEAAAKCR